MNVFSRVVWMLSQLTAFVLKLQQENLRGQKSICTSIFTYYSPGQNIWRKLKKSSKIGQDFKNLLPNFACFLTVIVKV